MNVGATIVNTLGKILDYVPFVSTGKGIVQLVKQLYQRIVSKSTAVESPKIEGHKWSLIKKEGNTLRNVVMCFPFAGNIAVAIADFRNSQKVKKLIGEPDEKGRFSKSITDDKLKEAVKLESGQAAAELAWRRMEKDLDNDVFEWSKKGVALGNGDAMFQLGACYIAGRGCVKDEMQAIKLFKEGVEKGSSFAMIALGRCFQEGKAGVTVNLSEAIKWYTKSAEMGNGMGMEMLAECYEKGAGVGLDIPKAISWYKKAAEKGDEDAQHHLHIYKNKILGLPDSNGRYPTVTDDQLKEAVNLRGAEAAIELAQRAKEKGLDKEHLSWLKMGAELGDTKAMNMLGQALQAKGSDKDLKEGVMWFKKSAEMKDVTGMFYLSDCYLEGRGVTKNLTEGFNSLRDSAALGMHQAMIKLARCYANGIGVEKDMIFARTWYTRASWDGDQEAKQWLDSHPETP